jgi:nitric oxide reductase large subunit
MSRRHLLIGLVALAAAAICAVLGLTQVSGELGTGTWTTYPAAFLALIAAIQFYKWLREPGGLVKR